MVHGADDCTGSHIEGRQNIGKAFVRWCERERVSDDTKNLLTSYFHLEPAHTFILIYSLTWLKPLETRQLYSVKGGFSAGTVTFH